MKLIFKDQEFDIEFNNTDTASKIANQLPISSFVDWKLWAEIYFLTNFGFEYSSKVKEILEIWDIVYWKSQKSDKEAIAIFFWNSTLWDWTKPLAASPCEVIWKIIDDIDDYKEINKWDSIELRS